MARQPCRFHALPRLPRLFLMPCGLSTRIPVSHREFHGTTFILLDILLMVSLPTNRGLLSAACPGPPQAYPCSAPESWEGLAFVCSRRLASRMAFTPLIENVHKETRWLPPPSGTSSSGPHRRPSTLGDLLKSSCIPPARREVKDSGKLIPGFGASGRGSTAPSPRPSTFRVPAVSALRTHARATLGTRAPSAERMLITLRSKSNACDSHDRPSPFYGTAADSTGKRLSRSQSRSLGILYLIFARFDLPPRPSAGSGLFEPSEPVDV